MKASHHVDVVLMAANIVHELNARYVHAAHQSIKSGHPVALVWPYAKGKDLGVICRFFGEPADLTALLAIIAPLAKHELIRICEIREVPQTARYIRIWRDRSIEKRKTEAALARCNATRIGKGMPPLNLKTKSPSDVAEINMLSASSGRKFTLFLRQEPCAVDAQPLGGSQYGFGFPVPFF